MGEINLTSLLDLTFVLLIAFMIVAPTLRPQIDVKVPENVPGTQAGTTNEDAIVITIGAKADDQALDRIYVTRKGRGDERITDMNNLVELLRDAKLRSPKVSVSIQVDGQVPSETFIRVIGACQEAEIEGVEIPTEPPPKRP